MESELTAFKIDVVNLVDRIGSINVVSDSNKLLDYLSKGDKSIKIQCAYLVIDRKIRRPNSIEELIDKTEEIYDFVIN
jgi:hypothetical protein